MEVPRRATGGGYYISPYLKPPPPLLPVHHAPSSSFRLLFFLHRPVFLTAAAFREMASGFGAFGGVGQCYRFWLGYADCRVRVLARRRSPAPARNRTDASLRMTHALAAILPCTPSPPPPSTCRPQLHAAHPALCLLENADYKECLHRDKLKRRIASKAVEHEAAKHPQPAAGHDHGHH